MSKPLIAARACAHFKSEKLKSLVIQQTKLGIEKYGQTLDDNNKPLAARVVHALQECVDLVQYLEWIADRALPREALYLQRRAKDVADLAESLLSAVPSGYDLTHKEGFKEG